MQKARKMIMEDPSMNTARPALVAPSKDAATALEPIASTPSILRHIPGLPDISRDRKWQIVIGAAAVLATAVVLSNKQNRGAAARVFQQFWSTASKRQFQSFL